MRAIIYRDRLLEKLCRSFVFVVTLGYVVGVLRVQPVQSCHI